MLLENNRVTLRWSAEELQKITYAIEKITFAHAPYFGHSDDDEPKRDQRDDAAPTRLGIPPYLLTDEDKRTEIEISITSYMLYLQRPTSCSQEAVRLDLEHGAHLRIIGSVFDALLVKRDNFLMFFFHMNF